MYFTSELRKTVVRMCSEIIQALYISVSLEVLECVVAHRKDMFPIYRKDAHKCSVFHILPVLTTFFNQGHT